MLTEINPLVSWSQACVHDLMEFKLVKTVWRESILSHFKNIVHGMGGASQMLVDGSTNVLEISWCSDCDVSFLKWSEG